jgi:ribosome maturation factor RimP
MKEEMLNRLARTAAEICQVQLYHLDCAARGRRVIVRVFIDKPGGVTVGDCERVSRELSALLDVEDPIPTSYNLEVSSPGLERRLYVPGHYRDHIGREVEVKTLRATPEGRKKWLGVLEQADEGGFGIRAEEGGAVRFEYPDVESCRLRFKF